MKEIHKASSEKREKKIEQIKEVLQQKEEVVFAYVFGSFLQDPVFRDIDVGVYLNDKTFEEDNSLDYSFELASEIEDEIGSEPMVDVRVLNQAPFYFLNNVFARGQLILCRDDDFLGNLIEKTAFKYLDYRPFAEQYLKERVKA